MAVEIPVVIDIDKAFQDAAKRTKTAMEPLEQTIERLTSDLGAWREILNESSIRGDDWLVAAKNIQNISERLAEADYELRRYTSNEGSIRRMSTDLAELERRWAAMGAQEKYTTNADGSRTFSAEAQKALTQYKQISEELQREGKTLAQLAAEENRIMQLRAKGVQSRRYENAILNTTVKSMRVLQEQERILSDRLSRTKVGTSAFDTLAVKLREVRREMSQVQKTITGTTSSTVGLTDAANKLGVAVTRSTTAMGRQSGVLMQLKSLAGMYVSVFGGLRLIRNIRETTAELELQKVALGGIIRDTDRATELFRQIKAAALKSPFEIKDLVTYTKQLSAYRIETDQLFDVTMRLADVSAGLGVDMNRLILAYGQVRAASVLRGQELRQFTEAGVPLVELLAQKFRDLGREGTTTADVFELISKRAVPFSMIEEIFKDMTSAGEMFYKMQEKQSETLKGQWMKLRDAVTIMYDEMGNTAVVHNAMESLIKTALSMARSWREAGNWIKAIVATLITYATVVRASAVASAALSKQEALLLAVRAKQAVMMPRVVSAIIGETAAKKASLWMTKRLEIAQYKLATATTLTGRAFWKLYAALMANPYAFAAAAVVGLVAGTAALIKNNKEAEVTVDSLSKAMEGLRNQASKAADTMELVQVYERLSDKAEKTKEDQEKLNRVTRDLAKTFPSAVSGIDKETGALQINIEKVRELTQAEYDLEQARLRAQEEGAKNRLAKLAKEREDILARYQAGGDISYTDMGEKILTPLSEKDLEKMGERLSEINKEMSDLSDTVQKIEDLDFVGPIPPSDFKAKATLKAWKQTLNEIQNEKMEAGAPQLFSSDDIEKLGSVHDLYKKIKTEIKSAQENLDGLRSIQSSLTDDEAKLANQGDIDAAEKYLDLIKAIQAAFGFTFKTSSGAGYTQDPFIKQMEERIKFMKDFQKGYEDLSKYMSKSGALGKEADIMLSRGLSLGIDAAEQKKAAEDLSQWYQDTIDSTFDYLQKEKGVTGSVEDFLSRQITGKTNRDKMLKDFQSLLQSLWDAKTDFDVTQEKKNWEDALKRLSDEIKRSETARNFYQDILDITGDEQLATTLGIQIYGNIGDEFKDRIQQELARAMDDVDAEKMTDELRKAMETQDFSTIMANLDKFPLEWQKRLQEMASDTQKFNADRAKDLLKALDRAKTYGEKQVELARQSARRIAEIQSLDVSDDVKNQMLQQNTRKQAEDAAKIAYEAFRDMPMYVELFDDLDNASTRMLKNMRQNLEDMRDNWKSLTPRELKELQSRINELDEQIATRNPFKALISSIREYRALQKERSQTEVEETAITANERLVAEKDLLATYQAEYDEAAKKRKEDEAGFKAAEQKLEAQAKVVDKAEQEAQAAQKTAQEYKEAKKHIRDAADKLSDWAGYINDSLDGVREIVSTFASDDTAETFDIIADGVSKTLNGMSELGQGIAKVATGDLTGIVEIIRGAGDFISGTFGTGKALQIKSINKRIEEQERLLGQLEYSYNRLDKAIAKAFGSDYIYNYNEQLKNLYAQQTAYEEQARLESEKGKKKDEKKVEEYKEAARDVADAIEDMGGQLSEFFAGSDLTSAAEEFANSWIDAYQEFGSTTGAIKDKFQDMINNMITKSLAGKAMQEMLRPIFDEIDRLAGDGELTAMEIGRISDMATAAIPQIDDAMTTLMNNLISSGIDLRTHAGQFTGISRDIAGASEESILGLAAGVNTANFYMSHLPAIAENVAALRVALVGDTPETVRTTASEGPTYEDQMLGFVGNLPQMRDDMYAVRTLLERVVKPKGQGGYAVVIQ